jgi:hypothetical protein
MRNDLTAPDDRLAGLEAAYAEWDGLLDAPLDALPARIMSFVALLGLAPDEVARVEAAVARAVAHPEVGWCETDPAGVKHVATLADALYEPLWLLAVAFWTDDQEFAAQERGDALTSLDAVADRDWRYLDEHHGLDGQLRTREVVRIPDPPQVVSGTAPRARGRERRASRRATARAGPDDPLPQRSSSQLAPVAVGARAVNACADCGLDFASVTAFDRHRVGKHAYTYVEGLRLDPPRTDGRRCLDEAERADLFDVDGRGRLTLRSRHGKAAAFFRRKEVAAEVER